MARPSKVWHRSDTGWWMITFGGEKLKLLKGPADAHLQQLAEEKFCEIRKLRRESPISPSARVADVIESFLAFSVKRYAAETHYSYRFYGQSFAEKYGQVPAAEVKPFHVTQWVDSKEWGTTTEYNARRSVFRVFNWATEEGILQKNPLKGMKRPKPQPRERALTDDEYRALLRNSTACFRRFLFMLRATGARPKELRTLKWDQVRSDRLVLKEHKTAKKTGKPRTIHLTGPAQKLIESLRGNGSESVFLNARGRPWTKFAVSLRVRRLKEKLGLAGDVCAYLARHAFGTAAVVNGVDVATVAELMGHTSLDMISTVYCHLADQHNHLADAAAKAARPSTPSPDARRPGA